MRRVSDVNHSDDPGLYTSPGEIIARAAATCPPRPAGDAASDAWRGAPERLAYAATSAHVEPGAERRSFGEGGSRAIPNRRAQRRWRDRMRAGGRYGSRLAALLAAGAILIGIPVWLWRSGTAAVVYRHAAATIQGWQHEVTSRAALTLDQIVVDGRERTSRDGLRAAIGLKRGDSLLATDPWAIRRRIEALPWVKSAAVERRHPGILAVKIVERMAIARLREGAAIRLVDDGGAVIAAPAEAEHQALLLVSGAGASRGAPALLKLLGLEPALARQVTAATRLGDRRWDLALENGATVRLPENHARAAWTKLAELSRQQNLLAHGAIVFDMRLPDRLVLRAAAVRTTPPTAPAPADKNAKKPKKTG